MPDERIIQLPYLIVDSAVKDQRYDLSKIIECLDVQRDKRNATISAFSKPRNLRAKKRLIIYGNVGSGKTRCLIELIKSLQPTRVFILNPNEVNEAAVKREHLAKTVSDCKPSDLIIWDNFPDGLEQASEQVARLAIKMLSSGKHRLAITLNPTYTNRREICEIERITGSKAIRLRYRQKDIRDILELNAKRTLKKEQFAAIKDDMPKIATRIWQVEPTPKMVIDFLELLTASNQDIAPGFKDPIDLVKRSPSSLEQYRHQFLKLKETQGDHEGVEFLYTIKICYELGLDRNIKSVLALQKMIFGCRATKKMVQTLAPWFYLSGNQISFHDIVKQSISLDEQAVLKTASFIAYRKERFSRISDQSAYLLGSFVGKHCSTIPLQVLFKLLPRTGKNLTTDIQSRRYYQIALGHEIGRTISNLNPNERAEILQAASTNSQFQRNLGEGAGWEIARTPSSIQREIFKYARNSLTFSRGLGLGVGMTLPQLSSVLKKEVFLQAETNAQFADGLGIGIGSIIEFLPEQMHAWLYLTAESNPEFARGLGTGLGHYFISLSERIQLYALSLIKCNSQFARGLGLGIGDVFGYLPTGLKQEALFHSRKNQQFAVGLGTGTGYSLSYLSPSLQEKVFKLCEKNSLFAYGAGLGLGITFYYFADDVKRRVLDLAKRNENFAIGLGNGYGLIYPTLTPEFQEEVVSRMSANRNIALGLGIGTGYGFEYSSHNLKKTLLELAKEDREYATGLGIGLGQTLKSQYKEQRAKTLSRMVAKSESIIFGVGQGIAFGIAYFSTEEVNWMLEIASKNPHFAHGFGKGVGATTSYYSGELRDHIFGALGSNADFMKGVTEGFEQARPYLDRRDRMDLSHLLLRRAKAH